MKIADVVKFVMANRQNKVCKEWSPYEITSSAARALKNKTLAYTTNNIGNLDGIVWGYPDYVKKELYIECILSTSKKVLPELMKYFLIIYDGWTLTAHRKGKFVKYSTKKLQKSYM